MRVLKTRHLNLMLLGYPLMWNFCLPEAKYTRSLVNSLHKRQCFFIFIHPRGYSQVFSRLQYHISLVYITNKVLTNNICPAQQGCRKTQASTAISTFSLFSYRFTPQLSCRCLFFTGAFVYRRVNPSKYPNAREALSDKNLCLSYTVFLPPSCGRFSTIFLLNIFIFRADASCLR